MDCIVTRDGTEVVQDLPGKQYTSGKHESTFHTSHGLRDVSRAMVSVNTFPIHFADWSDEK